MTCLPCSCLLVTVCCFVEVNLLLASAFVRSRWMASMTSGCWARTASPSFIVQSSFLLIIERTSGVATNDFTLSSQTALEFLVLRHPAIGLHDLKRVGRCHQNQGKEVVRVQCNWSDKRIKLFGFEQLVGRRAGRGRSSRSSWRLGDRHNRYPDVKCQNQ